MNLNFLVNPHGAGMPLVVWWYVAVSWVAMGVAAHVFRRSATYKASAEVSYAAGILVVLGLFTILMSYVPYALRKEPATSANYQSISNLLLWTAVLSVAACVLILLTTVLYVFIQRRSTVWHWPFLWLVSAQLALAYYAVLAANDRMATYEYWSWGFTEVALWTPWKYYAALAAALVFTVIAAGNLVLARKALRIDYSNGLVRRYMEEQFAWQPELIGWQHEPTRRHPHWSWVLTYLVPFKVYHLGGNLRQRRAQNPSEITWLDRLVAALAAMHGVQPPWDLGAPHNTNDDPEDGTPHNADCR